jgi:hypothetical protein
MVMVLVNTEVLNEAYWKTVSGFCHVISRDKLIFLEPCRHLPVNKGTKTSETWHG